ncbi:hypothetical protein GCM10007884_02310 [Methylobacterium brachythecii]|uniref:Uncharacterized protein n=1 Tax=Methylobacterium brachythecii TaxID=1176177 RepID=A0ABQ6CZN2_9HYPH|nr:hypothetical protein GCM10007884_02310 [Methylobacterium brachythecii]
MREDEVAIAQVLRQPVVIAEAPLQMGDELELDLRIGHQKLQHLRDALRLAITDDGDLRPAPFGRRCR